MAKQSGIIGLDIGSVSVNLVGIDAGGAISSRTSRVHGGYVLKAVNTLLDGWTGRVALTGISAGHIKPDMQVNSQVALIRGLRQLMPDVRTILYGGGERFGLIGFDEGGSYTHFKGNPACAAGTGSFLDQQAERLCLRDSAELAALAEANEGEIPKIATRCAVFAKTDLIHAQQEGWSLEAICDGLCRGLARNLADTLFDREVALPAVFAGGLALNRSVMRHLNEISGVPFLTDTEMSGSFAAYGAALELHDNSVSCSSRIFPGAFPAEENIFRSGDVYPPLCLELSEYPDFEAHDSHKFDPPGISGTGPVEVDVYRNGGAGSDLYLGVDVGSTSTKAALIDTSRQVLAGFYTRTAGRPVEALKGILSAMEDLSRRSGTEYNIIGSAATGSGRKLAGTILGSDVILDEISAHALAACEIDREVDTIIEIGGQDAKFTTLKNGRVTSSIMNNVCAAGTGSFLEEQGKKLGVAITDYAERTEGISAPLASDRCTVFMQRDLNHLLAEGWTVDEVLASALHAVRENYLQKVAVENRIGRKVFFQGATAKIRTLVAAFEQKLQQPVLVSPWCHLTGALGAALDLSDRRVISSSFRGLGIWREEIPVKTEVCELCTNHCKLTVVQSGGKPAAFGFLCGREYEEKKYVKDTSSSFSLERAVKKAGGSDPAPVEPVEHISLGLPSGLYLKEDQVYWKRFFSELGIPVVCSDSLSGTLQEGRRYTRSEFCAPLTELHGQVHLLAEKCRHVFLPVYTETSRDKKDLRKFCYYSQFAPAMLAQQFPRGTVLTPVVKSLSLPFKSQVELYRMLKNLGSSRHYTFLQVKRAMDAAQSAVENYHEALVQYFTDEVRNPVEDVQVVLLGRPYTVLSPQMNKGIPVIFSRLGIPAFFQDMVPRDADAVAAVKPLMEEIHWNYASGILETTESIARRPGFYPVFITSFKCSPDSYLRTYFRQLMEAHDKPYLVLELDEHGSSVGYETRIEAAVRAFRNHHKAEKRDHPVPVLSGFRMQGILPDLSRDLRGKTLLLPNWDRYTIPLIAANLKHEGIDARVLDESQESIRRGLSRNDGQCIPMNAVAEEAVAYVRRNKLEPAKTLLWMMKSDLACNIAMYPHHIRTLFKNYPGMEELGVFSGDITFGEVSVAAAVNTYFAFLFGGLLRRIGCRLRPYEKVKGETDRILGESLIQLEEAFLGKRKKKEVVEEIIRKVEAIHIVPGPRLKVAIFGDIYVRDNDVFNQDLISFIEEHGGEVITTPYSQYAKMIAEAYFRRWFAESRFTTLFAFRTLLAAVELLERSYRTLFEGLLSLSDERYDQDPEEILQHFDMRIEHSGESMDNILKVWYIKEHYPDISLFVQTSPGFCCAGLITEAMADRIEQVTGVPVVCLTYDGTGGNPNESLVPYLRFPRKEESAAESELQYG